MSWKSNVALFPFGRDSFKVIFLQCYNINENTNGESDLISVLI